jgi:hypothetical protein
MNLLFDGNIALNGSTNAKSGGNNNCINFKTKNNNTTTNTNGMRSASNYRSNRRNRGAAVQIDALLQLLRDVDRRRSQPT